MNAPETCQLCGGTGSVRMAWGIESYCGDCHGAGLVNVLARCETCGRPATARARSGSDWGREEPEGRVTCGAHMGGSGSNWGRPLILRETWNAMRGGRRPGQAINGETTYDVSTWASSVLTAHAPDRAPAVWTRQGWQPVVILDDHQTRQEA